MRIRLEEPTLADELFRALKAQTDCIVERVDDRELEAVLVGSYRDGGRDELMRLIEEWNAERKTKAPLRIVR
jgi:hypothetical protein